MFSRHRYVILANRERKPRRSNPIIRSTSEPDFAQPSISLIAHVASDSSEEPEPYRYNRYYIVLLSLTVFITLYCTVQCVRHEVLYGYSFHLKSYLSRIVKKSFIPR